MFYIILCLFRVPLTKSNEFFNFCGKIITSLASKFTIENSLFKTIFGHKNLICQPISKLFATPVAKNFVLNTDMKFVCHFSNNFEYFLKIHYQRRKRSQKLLVKSERIVNLSTNYDIKFRGSEVRFRECCFRKLLILLSLVSIVFNSNYVS